MHAAAPGPGNIVQGINGPHKGMRGLCFRKSTTNNLLSIRLGKAHNHKKILATPASNWKIIGGKMEEGSTMHPANIGGEGQAGGNAGLHAGGNKKALRLDNKKKKKKEKIELNPTTMK